MVAKKSVVFNIVAFITLLNFVFLICDIFCVDRSSVLYDYEPVYSVYETLLKCTSFGITLIIFILYPVEFFLLDKYPHLKNKIDIKNPILNKVHSFCFYFGYSLFIFRLILFIIFNVMAMEFMWEL